MTSVFLNLLTDVFNSYAKRINFEDFCYWLLNIGEQKQNSMIYQLLGVTRQNSKLAAQVERAKDRLKQRRSEKESLQSSEATSAFTNSIDNRVEEFQSLVFSMSPVEDGDDQQNVYSNWLYYLHRQFIALTHLDYELAVDVKSIAVKRFCSDAKLTDAEDNFINVLELQDNERTHFSSVDTDVLRAPVDQVRALVLFRIQNCLLSRAVTGTFIEHIPFQTDHSATISSVATGRYLAAHCMDGLRNLHDAQSVSSNQDVKARYTYVELLKLLSSHNSQLDDALTLPKSSFPLQYSKKTTEAFESQTRALIDEFTLFYESLSSAEQRNFRKDPKTDDVMQQPLENLSKRRLRREKVARKVANNDDDDNDNDADTIDDEDENRIKKPRFSTASGNSSAVATSVTTMSSAVATTTSSLANLPTSSTPSIFDNDLFFGGGNNHDAFHSSHHGLNSLLTSPCLSHENFLWRKTASRMHSPRAVPLLTQRARASLDEELEKSCTNCAKLQLLLREMQSKEKETSTADLVSFLSQDVITSGIAMSAEITNVDFEQQLRVANDQCKELEATHRSQLLSANETIARLQEELALAKSQLAASQSLQISTQNLRVLAERKVEKFERQQKTRSKSLPTVSISSHWDEDLDLSFL